MRHIRSFHCPATSLRRRWRCRTSKEEARAISRAAVENYGGKVKVKSAEGSVCVVQYKGPPPLAKGIQAAIKDRFPTLTTIKIESF